MSSGYGSTYDTQQERKKENERLKVIFGSKPNPETVNQAIKDYKDGNYLTTDELIVDLKNKQKET